MMMPLCLKESANPVSQNSFASILHQTKFLAFNKPKWFPPRLWFFLFYFRSLIPPPNSVVKTRNESFRFLIESATQTLNAFRFMPLIPIQTIYLGSAWVTVTMTATAKVTWFASKEMPLAMYHPAVAEFSKARIRTIVFIPVLSPKSNFVDPILRKSLLSAKGIATMIRTGTLYICSFHLDVCNCHTHQIDCLNRFHQIHFLNGFQWGRSGLFPTRRLHRCTRLYWRTSRKFADWLLCKTKWLGSRRSNRNQVCWLWSNSDFGTLRRWLWHGWGLRGWSCLLPEIGLHVCPRMWWWF